MHTVGGGVALRAFETIFQLDPKGRKAPKIGADVMVKVNMHMNAWSASTPMELARNVQSFERRKHWKMREAHEALVYHSIPLMGLRWLRQKVQEDKANAFIALVYGVHLIGRTTHQSPSDTDIKHSDTLLRHYVRIMVKGFTKEWLIYKNHCLIHLATESKVYGSHLGGVDAYPFENFLTVFRKKLIKSGKGVLTQCYNRLKELSYHSLSRDENDELEDYDIDTDRVAQLMIKHGSMELPAQTILKKHVNSTSKKKYVKCLGFTVSCEYPNNVLVLSSNGVVDFSIVFVQDMYLSDGGDVFLITNAFKNVRPAHETLWNIEARRLFPAPLSAIGCFEARFGLEEESEKISFSKVVGKCFPFHMNLNVSRDPKDNLFEGACTQWWTIVQMKHTMPPKTFVDT